MREPAECAEQAQRAQEDVAIEHDQPFERDAVGECAYRNRRKAARPQPPQHPCAERETACVRSGRRGADTGNTPAEAIHVEQHGADVHRIDEHLRDEREPHALHAEQVAEHDVVRERERGAPDSRVAVGERRGRTASLPPSADSAKTAAAPAAPVPRRRARTRRSTRSRFRRIPAASPAPCACATRPVVPIRRKPKPQNTKLKNSPPSATPPRLRAVEVARDGRVDGTEDRLGQVREDDREREREDAPMRDGGRAGPVR